MAMPFQTQERAQTQTDRVALGAGGPDLYPLNAAILLDASMIVRNRPSITGEAHARQRGHPQVVGGPPFLVAIWGDDQEQTDQTIAFQIDDVPRASVSARASGRNPVQSGLTRRSAFNRASQTQTRC